MADRFRFAILDDYQRIARDLADWDSIAGLEIDIFSEHIADEDSLAERLARYDGVLLMRERTPMPRGLIEMLPGLRLIVTTGSRNASIDIMAAKERGIAVCGTRAMTTPAPELAWALVMSLMRRVTVEDAAIRKGAWQTGVGISLAGARLGLIGLGRTGECMARFGRAFGMEVVAWSLNLDEARARECDVRAVSKDEMFRTSDVVSVHVRGGSRYAGAVSTGELNLMKPSAFLVNTSRTEIVDEEALIDALRSGTISGAALDVFRTEPFSAGERLLNVPNLLLTPHIGYVTRQNYECFFSDALECVAGYLAGSPVREILTD